MLTKTQHRSGEIIKIKNSVFEKQYEEYKHQLILYLICSELKPMSKECAVFNLMLKV